MSNPFGYDYPAGAENDPNAPWNQKDNECPDCEGAKKVCVSDCCGEDFDEDTGICPYCKEHCNKSDCETCDGQGHL